MRISDDQNTLKAGERGPSLLEDFIFREKITHFDHERIPECVVHARGAGAYGYFQVYEPMAELTKAKFLQDPTVQTSVFVRFSTVAGSRGSPDLARDVRGFAAKFYTEDGNFDLVGNNIPVFFIAAIRASRRSNSNPTRFTSSKKRTSIARPWPRLARGGELLNASYVRTGSNNAAVADMQADLKDEAVVIGDDGQARKVADDFIKAIARHRNWTREKTDQVPA